MTDYHHLVSGKSESILMELAFCLRICSFFEKSETPPEESLPKEYKCKPPSGWHSGRYDCYKIHQKKTLTGGSAFCVSTPFLRKKIDRFKGKNRVQNEISLFLEPIIFGEVKSTDFKAMGSWTDVHQKRVRKKHSRLLPWPHGVFCCCDFVFALWR